MSFPLPPSPDPTMPIKTPYAPLRPSRRTQNGSRKRQASNSPRKQCSFLAFPCPSGPHHVPPIYFPTTRTHHRITEQPNRQRPKTQRGKCTTPEQAPSILRLWNEMTKATRCRMIRGQVTGWVAKYPRELPGMASNPGQIFHRDSRIPMQTKASP